MNLKMAAPATFGTITFTACITVSTVAHYGDQWLASYALSIFFAACSIFVAALADS